MKTQVHSRNTKNKKRITHLFVLVDLQVSRASYTDQGIWEMIFLMMLLYLI